MSLQILLEMCSGRSSSNGIRVSADKEPDILAPDDHVLTQSAAVTALRSTGQHAEPIRSGLRFY